MCEEIKKEIHLFYSGMYKIHQRYANKRWEDPKNMDAFISDINRINDTYQCDFCNTVTNCLREWYKKGFCGVQNRREEYQKVYIRLSILHRKYAEQCPEVNYAKFIDEAEKIATDYPGVPWVKTIMLGISEELENQRFITAKNVTTE